MYDAVGYDPLTRPVMPPEFWMPMRPLEVDQIVKERTDTGAAPKAEMSGPVVQYGGDDIIPPARFGNLNFGVFGTIIIGAVALYIGWKFAKHLL